MEGRVREGGGRKRTSVRKRSKSGQSPLQVQKPPQEKMGLRPEQVCFRSWAVEELLGALKVDESRSEGLPSEGRGNAHSNASSSSTMITCNPPRSALPSSLPSVHLERSRHRRERLRRSAPRGKLLSLNGWAPLPSRDSLGCTAIALVTRPPRSRRCERASSGAAKAAGGRENGGAEGGEEL